MAENVGVQPLWLKTLEVQTFWLKTLEVQSFWRNTTLRFPQNDQQNLKVQTDFIRSNFKISSNSTNV